MPRTSGHTLLHEVKKGKHQPEFILLSGYLPQERLEALKTAGLQRHLLKPLSIRELLANVAAVLAGPEGSADSSGFGPRQNRADRHEARRPQ